MGLTPYALKGVPSWFTPVQGVNPLAMSRCLSEAKKSKEYFLHMHQNCLLWFVCRIEKIYCEQATIFSSLCKTPLRFTIRFTICKATIYE